MPARQMNRMRILNPMRLVHAVRNVRTALGQRMPPREIIERQKAYTERLRAQEAERTAMWQREERQERMMHEIRPHLEKIQEILNYKPISDTKRRSLPREQKEIYDIRFLFFKELSEGNIRPSGNFMDVMKDFHIRMQKWLHEQHQNPAYAKIMVRKLMQTFSLEQRQNLQYYMGRIAHLMS